jgi:formyltetrahydrofolate-dependent phosphoribosylglycinamide formyltransferase
VVLRFHEPIVLNEASVKVKIGSESRYKLCPVKKIAILIGSRGRGTNMANLIGACHEGRIAAETTLVVSPVEGNPGSLRAVELGVPVLVLPPKDIGYSLRLLACLEVAQVDLVCLAGYMSLLPSLVVSKFQGRVLNVHPALLPKFGGKGMYGNHVHEAVLAAGETQSGCTVHYVTEQYDEGAILDQETCHVLPDDTAETLASRVLQCEMICYPRAINTWIQQASL